MQKKMLADFHIKENLTDTIIKDSLVVSRKCLKKGSEIPMHWHDYFEIEIVVCGEIEHSYNNRKFNISKGDTFLMSYCDCHSLSCLTDVELINIRFYEEFLCKELSDYIAVNGNGFVCNYDENELNLILDSINKILFEHKNEYIFKDIMVQNIVSEIVIDIIRKTNDCGNIKIPELVQGAVREIYRSFRTDISVESIAESVGVTANYFGVTFRNNLGVSFNEYLNKVRLRYACNLLESSDFSVREIAFLAGYNSAEYFMYVFKKYILTSPNVYRKRYK